MVKTLTKKVEKAEAKILRLDAKNAQMEGLAVKLTQTEEQLEYASAENDDFAVRVHALEQALLMQETELDDALDTIREQKQARKQRLESEKGTNPFDDETNPFAADDADEQLANRQELTAVRKELESLRYERDRAVERATNVSIQLAELRAETDETRDQLVECLALLEHLKAQRQQSSSSSVGSSTSKFSFLWAKRDSKSVKSNHDDTMLDQTEDDSSVCSEDWEVKQMDYPERSQAVVLAV
jgi:chromosome segregation ATPase